MSLLPSSSIYMRRHLLLLLSSYLQIFDVSDEEAAVLARGLTVGVISNFSSFITVFLLTCDNLHYTSRSSVFRHLSKMVARNTLNDM